VQRATKRLAFASTPDSFSTMASRVSKTWGSLLAYLGLIGLADA
jgi:hypothetical protein